MQLESSPYSLQLEKSPVTALSTAKKIKSINSFKKSMSKAQNLTLRSHVYFKGGDITNGYKTAWTLVRLARS